MQSSLVNVLVVEDEADSLELVQGLLDYHGIASKGVTTASEALEALESYTPCMIIIDLSLPDLDGWSLLHQLQAMQSLDEVPKVAITSYHDLALAQIALKAGFSAYFPKPIDAASFVQALQTLVVN